MSTLPKKIAAKKPAATANKKVSTWIGGAKGKVPVTTKPRTPPPAKSTAGDLLKLKDFGKGLNGTRVEEIIADRAR